MPTIFTSTTGNLSVPFSRTFVFKNILKTVIIIRCCLIMASRWLADWPYKMKPTGTKPFSMLLCNKSCQPKPLTPSLWMAGAVPYAGQSALIKISRGHNIQSCPTSWFVIFPEKASSSNIKDATCPAVLGPGISVLGSSRSGLKYI